MNKKHPSFRKLSEYYDNELSSLMKKSISEHISKCKKCCLLLDSFKSYSSVVQNNSLPSSITPAKIYLFKSKDKNVSLYIKKAINIAAVFIFIIGLSFFSMFLSEQNKNPDVTLNKNSNSNSISLSKLIFPLSGSPEALFYLTLIESNNKDNK